jgi:hypothetical protein
VGDIPAFLTILALGLVFLTIVEYGLDVLVSTG